MPRLPTTRFILVRHGQGTGNVAGHLLMGGWTDLPLTADGSAEARLVAARLLREPAPSAIFSSPLQRAVQTALAIGERLAMPRIVTEAALREIHCGEVDGWPVERVQERYPDEWANNSRQTDPDFRWPGGESYREFRARVLAAMAAIARRHMEQRVVVVTHAGVISQLIGWVRGESAARWEPFRPHTASVTELAWRGASAEVVRFDDRAAGPT